MGIKNRALYWTKNLFQPLNRDRLHVVQVCLWSFIFWQLRLSGVTLCLQPELDTLDVTKSLLYVCLWGCLASFAVTLIIFIRQFLNFCFTVWVGPSSMYSCFCLLYGGQLTSPGPLGELGMYMQRRSLVYVPCSFILQKYHNFICKRQLHSCVPLWVASFKYFLLQPANLLQSLTADTQLILIKLITYCNNSCQAFGSGSWCAVSRKAEIRYIS